ncbi:MAG: transposase [Selenomonadaceae bacterium]|nr:transposase [Selenomonadaceae bacterium]
MLYTLKIRLYPSPEQAAQLLRTMERFNDACNLISQIAFDNKTFGKTILQRLCYYQIRNKFKLSSQMVVRAIAKVCESYSDKKKRENQHTFKPHGAIVYDDRILTVKSIDKVSILTLDGRIFAPMSVCQYHARILDKALRVRGQTDLGCIDGKFYLFLVAECADEPETITKDFLGVDLGIAKIATTSDGKFYSGSKVKNIRRRYFRLRQRLQAKGTKSAKRKLKQRRRKESRFATNVNHCISKRLVEVAKGTQRAIVLEDLKGIRQRARKGTRQTVCKTMRQALSSWSFYQLRQFIEYKARAAGVLVIYVDPRNTSRTCSKCGHVDKKSRRDQEHFVCTACGHALNADINAALNISRRGAAVIQPNVAKSA